MNSESMGFFPGSYEASRSRFRAQLAVVQARWPKAELHHHTLAEHPDLSIDWIQAYANQKPDKLFMLTTGQHGAEGFVGAAMLQLFIEEYLPRLNPDDTGLLLVHAINPWGMKHFRRVNPHNVDLNRNFVWDETDLNPAANPDYRLLNTFLNPTATLRSLALSKASFFFKLIKTLISPGQATLRAAMLMGQYAHPEGVYYGGEELQEETRVMMQLYRQAIRQYDHIVHLDMHTGYGPRFQMSLVNSPLEKRSARDLARDFGYPPVVAATPDAFYTMHGDMIDWMYRLIGQEHPGKHLYAAAFEFGTLGDSLMASIRSMRAIIAENRVYWHGAAGERIRQKVRQDFRALFSPHEADWREKALADARRAFEGILAVEGYFE